MSIDAPDWQRIIKTVEAMGDVPDAPDWERIVVGPGGTPVTAAAGASPFSPYFAMGMLGVTIDGTTESSGRSPTAGKPVFQAFTAGATGTINNIYLYIVTGASVTTNENFLSIYDWGVATANTYTLLGQTPAGDVDAAFKTTGIAQGTLSTGVPVVAGETYVMSILCGGNYPSITSLDAVDTHINNPFFPATPISTVSTASHTTPPPTKAYSATTGNQTTWWALMGP